MTFAAIVLVALATAVAVGPRPVVVRVRRALGESAPRRGARSSAVNTRHDPASEAGAIDLPAIGSRSPLSGARPRAMASIVAAAAIALFVSAPAVVVIAPAVAAGTWWLLGRAEPAEQARYRRRLDIEVPLAAELLAAALAAGCPVGGAVSMVGRSMGGPLGAALCRCAAAAGVGSDPVQVWAPLRAEPALVPLARALEAAVARGTSPVPALQRIAEDTRLAARWAAQGRARALGARAAAPLGLCFLPAFVLLAVVPLVATSGAGLF